MVAESDVLPVPERPKYTADLPLSGSTLAEQCMESTLSSTGSR